MKLLSFMQNHDVFARILRATLILLGVWAMYAQTSVFLGRSFNQLVTGSWIPFLAIVLLMFCFRKSRFRKDDAGEQFIDVGNRTVLFLGIASIAGMLIFRPGNPISALIYAIAVLIALSRIGDSVTASTVPAENFYNKKQRWIVVVVMLASMIIALCEHRVNWDDAKYLHIVASALDHPNEPMLVYDNLHGVKGLKVYHPSVQLQTYELLVATISRVFAVNHLHVYYLILPPFWAALSVIAQWILIRRIAGKYAPLALVTTFVMLALWGGHRSYGSFAVDFVGRGIFLTFAVPALISASLDLVEMATARKWLLLFLSAWTGCLLTSTAYAVAPVAVFLVLISCYGLSIQRLREFAFGTLAVLWCPLVLGYVTFVAPIVTPVDVDTPGNVHTVFKGGQGRIALILFGLAPFFTLFAKLQSARWLLRYVALSAVVLFSGIFLDWIGTHSSILSWRLLWAIPVPAIVGVGLSASISFLIERWIPEGGLRSSGTL